MSSDSLSLKKLLCYFCIIQLLQAWALGYESIKDPNLSFKSCVTMSHLNSVNFRVCIHNTGKLRELLQRVVLRNK